LAKFLPDLKEFYDIKVIPQDCAVAKQCLEISSYHSPISITLIADALNREKEPILSNRHTNWDNFRGLVSERLIVNIPLKSKENIEAAAKFFTDTIQSAGSVYTVHLNCSPA
jgi:hypothetical protein